MANYNTLVLILVLMEDALVPFKVEGVEIVETVLILVLMEDALVLGDLDKKVYLFRRSLNPCFNGRCTRTGATLAGCTFFLAQS